jgi:Flp pilus assembly pilin Flp
MVEYGIKTLSRAARDERGATMVEYAVMLGFIAAICLVLVIAIGVKTSSEFSNLNAVY